MTDSPCEIAEPKNDNSSVSHAHERLALEPMDPQLTCIQPGGGYVVKLELAWGCLRRWYLKTFRRRYVKRMRALQNGEATGCPHEVIDSRDLKFFRNQTGCAWAPQDDRFRWRDALPFARVGLAELIVFSVATFCPAAVLVWLAAARPLAPAAAYACWILAAALVLTGGLIVWFFRNPKRSIPIGAGVVVAPADGKIVAVDEVDDDEFVDGPAVVVGIFLSIFNVHINRMPVAARVIGLRYRPGKCLNALRPESARENEQLAIRIEEREPPHRRMVVRQITGAIARRIVCWLKPGDELECGEQFGMIKLGSRAELVLPREDGLELAVSVGDKVRAGSSLVARYVQSADAEGQTGFNGEGSGQK